MLSFRRYLAWPLAALALLIGVAPAFATSQPNVNLQVILQGSNAAPSNVLSSSSQSINLSSLFQLLSGTGTGQADTSVLTTRTIAASGSDTLDLCGASATLTDAFGASASFLHVKWVLIRAAAANTNNVVVGGAASNTFLGPFSSALHTVAVKPGELMLVTAATGAGWACVDTTGDQFKIANSGSGTSVTYDLILIGTST